MSPSDIGRTISDARESPPERERGPAGNEAPHPTSNSRHDQRVLDASVVARSDIPAQLRRRRARRASWRAWHHLADYGLMSSLADEVLREIIREAG